MKQYFKWICAGGLLLGFMLILSHNETVDIQLPKDEEVGKISYSPEWENKTYDYEDGYFFKRESTWALIFKSDEYIPYGFNINDRFYSVNNDCEEASYGAEEEYHYSCMRNDDDQHYYVRMTKYPYNIEVLHPSVLPEENPY